jgi:riboflavin synthase
MYIAIIFKELMMFTGLVNQVGKIISIEKKLSHWVVMIAPQWIYKDIQRGESISVSGICLSVESFKESGELIFSCVHQTIHQTSLVNWQVGDFVNLERALLMSDRLGGHMVQGHVDGVGEILSRVVTPEYSSMEIRFPEFMYFWIVPKGYITVDGMSLTIQSICDITFTIALVPITEEITIVSSYRLGHYVNLEADIITKTTINFLEKKSCLTR